MTMLSELLDSATVAAMREQSVPATVLFLKGAGGRYKRKTFPSLRDAQTFIDSCLDKGWNAKLA